MSKPSFFIMRNSKGYPDFIMTMLVAVTLCLFVLLLFWMSMNIVGVYFSITQESFDNGVLLLKSINDNSRLIILGVCSSVFSLAGAYYLRRANHDKHQEEMRKLELQEDEDLDI